MNRWIVAAIALATFSRPLNAAKLTPCALSAAQHFVIPAECASFRTRQIHDIARITSTAFAGDHEPATIASLADGAVVVEVSSNGLFRIDSAGTVSEIWAPRQSNLPYQPLSVTPWPGQPAPTPAPRRPNYAVELIGAFNHTAVFQYASTWVYGVSESGSVDFRFPRRDYATTMRPNFVGLDPDGTVWLDSWSPPLQRDLIYAFRPKTDILGVLPVTVLNAFQGPSGFIYATLGKSLVELHSTPQLGVRYVRGPIALPPGSYGMRDIAVWRIGSDGSAWASTATELVHEHPDGHIVVIRLTRLPITIVRPIGPIHFQVAPDGAVWINGYERFVRVTVRDSVAVIPLATGYNEPQFAADGSVWLISPTAGGNTVLHFAPPSD